MADHYSVLGVSKQATETEIKKAYRSLARQYHPDANPGDAEAEAKFKEIANAYEVLGDQDRRNRYDRFGDDGLGGQGGAGAGNPFGGGGLGDIFETFFGGGNPFGGGPSGPTGPPRGEDLESVLEVDLIDAVFGGEQMIKVRTAVSCDPCEATGAEPGSGTSTCRECGGSGQVQRVRQSILGQMVTQSACGSCGGRGETIDKVCTTCKGEGRKIETVSYTVDVPAGVDSGSTLRLSGRGAVGPRGGAMGDLYVHISVKPNARYTRDGIDLYVQETIGIAQATLGTELQVETLDDPELILVPKGTNSGKTFRLKGFGVPQVNGRGRGDLVVELIVKTPAKLSHEEESLLRQFAELRGEHVDPADEGFLSRVKSAFK
ncbi:MAG: molecular chaperone DnaJ [Acidimicrobiales bacterium]|nr:MAG: molecular chaperone DnaJ [Acidimicrobiales bacterium]